MEERQEVEELTVTINTDALGFPNPLVSSEPQVHPIGIVGVFEYKMVDLEHFKGIRGSLAPCLMQWLGISVVVDKWVFTSYPATLLNCVLRP